MGEIDYDHDFDDGQCSNCDGEGYVAMCMTEYACVDPEYGCDQCMVLCDWCKPKPAPLDPAAVIAPLL
jgi:hypothetical protein